MIKPKTADKLQAKTAKPSKPEKVPPVTLDSIKSLPDRRKLQRLVDEYRAAGVRMAADKEIQADNMKLIKPLAEKLGFNAVATNDWTLYRMPGRKTLKKELLVNQGVSLKVIALATVQGEGGWAVKGKKGNGEAVSADEE